ncbi:MAG: substrate-binding periplasmic protein [Geminicoccaceae bacterium]
MLRFCYGLLAAFVLFLCPIDGSAREVVIGFAGHSAPFVLPDQDNPGISVEIARKALKLAGHDMTPAYQSYKRIKEEVKQGRLNGAAAMPKGEENLYYSEPCIAFDNVAIVRKRDNITIDSIGDLPGHSVVAWQNAHEHLGGEFLKLFGRHVREDYVRKYFDLADQAAQVRMFWSGRADVIVIDDVIFDYMTSTMSDDFDTNLALERNRIFGGLTVFSFAFTERELRDEFDKGLAKLRAEGGIERIYQKYRTAKTQRTAAVE